MRHVFGLSTTTVGGKAASLFAYFAACDLQQQNNVQETSYPCVVELREAHIRKLAKELVANTDIRARVLLSVLRMLCVQKATIK